MYKWYACASIHSDDWFPKRILNFFGLLCNPIWMIVEGPFDTKEDAITECERINEQERYPR